MTTMERIYFNSYPGFSWKCKGVWHHSSLLPLLCPLAGCHSNHLKSTSGQCVTSRVTPEMTAWLSRWCVASISISLRESRHVTLQDLGGNLRIESALPVLGCLQLTAKQLSMQQAEMGWGVNSWLNGLQNHFGMLRARSNRSHKTPQCVWLHWI